MSRFLETLHSGRILLMDGAMGTELRRAGLGDRECGELWNLTHPDRVTAIHRTYVDAGAECLLTNTFQANPVRLAQQGAGEKLAAIHQAAAALAHSVAGPQRFVLADLGPIVEPASGKEFADLEMVQQVARCIPRVDALLLETCSTPRVRWAVRYAHSFSRGLPVLLSLTYQRDPVRGLCTYSGHLPEWFARRARQYGVAALGVNCGRDIGMDEIIEIVRRYRKVTDQPLFARPNAGTPKRIGQRWVYPHSPRDMAARLPELLEAGVCMVGGCCGSTPAHIAAFRPIIDEWNATRKN
jgi:5-methyltetrahydrofolate--homocysteine methyltransferase